ncbi:MAG: hypothetical protein V5A34_13125, partial [Halapricum sp.]
DVVQVALWNDDGNNYQNGDEEPFFVGSLRDVIVGELGDATPPGVLLPGDIPAEDGGGMGDPCFSAETEHSVAFAWWVPIDHGNEIQTDSVTFDLGLYTEQCRHNKRTSTVELPTDSYIGYEDRPESGDFDYNDFGMRASILETYEDDDLQEIDMEFSAEEYQAGDSHVINVERALPDDVEWEYELTRSGSDDGELSSSRTTDGTGGSPATGSGSLEIALFDTGSGLDNTSTIDATVEVSVTITSGSEAPPTGTLRPDVAANNPLFEVYDTVMEPDGADAVDLSTVQSGITSGDIGGDTTENWDNEADVPNIIVVPDVDFQPSDEATTISTDYPEFDDYYAGGTTDDGIIEVDDTYEDWYDLSP